MQYLFFIFFMNMLYAQHAEQPQPVDTDDARASIIVFELRDLRDNKSFSLERSPYHDHFIRLKQPKNEKLQKADSKLAKNLDAQFSTLYLKAMYEMESKKGKCQESYRLFLRGDEQIICKKDDQKAQVIKSFIQLLEKQF